jgi:hypothetical protein
MHLACVVDGRGVFELGLDPNQVDWEEDGTRIITYISHVLLYMYFFYFWPVPVPAPAPAPVQDLCA